MSLVRPRTYQWVPDPNWPGAPFVTAESNPDPNYPYNRWLQADDGHRVPFPRRVLRAESYWYCQTCRVRVLIEDGRSPTFPGVNYWMEINVSGRRRLSDQAAQVLRRWGGPRTPQFGVPGQVAMSVLHPSDLAGETHWNQRIRRWDGEVMVRYTYLPVM